MFMAAIVKLDVTLPSDMVRSIKDAVNRGDYATTSDVISHALRDWREIRAMAAAQKSKTRPRRPSPKH
jgi:antitoxin ParD1/3/4